METDEPAWPAWFAAAGGIGGLALVVAFSLPVIGILIALGLNEKSTAVVVIGTLVQDAVLVGVAVMLARSVGPVHPRHFGLRRYRLKGAIGWLALGMVMYYVALAIYGSLIHLKPDTAPEELGADKGTLAMLIFVLIVVMVAPVAEELFFRGFIFKSLQGRFGITGAAILSSAFFGLLHWDGTADRLAVIAPLGIFGLVLCWIYTRTGSIFPNIAAHATNNAAASLSFAFGLHSRVGEVAAVAALLTVYALVIALPRLLPKAVPPSAAAV